jgi:hypothetical protein
MRTLTAGLMPEAHELRSVIEAANQAAAGGDYVAAELNCVRRLRFRSTARPVSR